MEMYTAKGPSLYVLSIYLHILIEEKMGVKILGNTINNRNCNVPIVTHIFNSIKHDIHKLEVKCYHF